MKMNGHTHPDAHPPPDHTPLIVHLASTVGEVKGEVRELGRRIDRIEMRPPTAARRPMSDWLTLIGGAVVVAAAAAGKIGWDQVPSLLLGGK